MAKLMQLCCIAIKQKQCNFLMIVVEIKMLTTMPNIIVMK